MVFGKAWNLLLSNVHLQANSKADCFLFISYKATNLGEGKLRKIQSSCTLLTNSFCVSYYLTEFNSFSVLFFFFSFLIFSWISTFLCFFFNHVLSFSLQIYISSSSSFSSSSSSSSSSSDRLLHFDFVSHVLLFLSFFLSFSFFFIFLVIWISCLLPCHGDLECTGCIPCWTVISSLSIKKCLVFVSGGNRSRSGSLESVEFPLFQLNFISEYFYLSESGL